MKKCKAKVVIIGKIQINLGSPTIGKSVLCQVYASKGHFTSDYNMVSVT
jgi:hypothetical protein